MTRFVFAILLLNLLSTHAHAATRNFEGYQFNAYVVGDSHSRGRLYESWDGANNIVRVTENQEYSIVVNNPLPVRVGVALTVDGLNTLDGKRTRPSAGQKWLIDPYSSITIRGWQTNDSSMRKFYFTRPENTYAKWKGRYDRQDYMSNLGVIGIAYFWDSRELQRALHPPEPFLAEDEMGLSNRSDGAPSSMIRKRNPGKKAGTGMGRKTPHYVRSESFSFDRGMYSNSDVLKIFYQFGQREPSPQPFIDDSGYRYPGNYAPEMP